jgi:hypothetical protein
MPVFVPTRAAGLSRLESFLPRVVRYAEDRNFDRPHRPATSQLSPWLRHRLLTEEEVVATVLDAQPWSKVEKYLQEVCWRTYWKGWLEHNPAIWTRYREAVVRGLASPPSGYAQAIAGETGIPGFDDWARELSSAGWLHNHARMWFASIWIFTLRLPWELGADFFLRHLLDGDPASNTLSWRWVAGLHTPGKVYLARADNIRFHTEGRYDPSGKLAEAAVPLTEPALPESVPLWTTADNPVVTAPVGWWLHPEDLAVDLLDGGEVQPTTVLAAWPENLASVQGWSGRVTAFTQAALADGASRAAQSFGASVHVTRTDSLPNEAVAWARAHGLRTVVAMRPAVGPWLEKALAVEAALLLAGVQVVWRRREWDTVLYPHAEKGFFPFWAEASRRLFATSGHLRLPAREQTADPV